MRLSILLSLPIILSLSSCEKESIDPIDPNQWNISRVEGLTFGTINQTVYLTVYYPTSSGCDIFDNFKQTEKGSIISIKAYGHTDTSSICTAVALERSTLFSFNPTSTGVYELRFYKRDNSYIVHSVTIN